MKIYNALSLYKKLAFSKFYKAIITLTLLFCFTSTYAVTYYSKATGLAPNVLTSWVTNTNGTGTSPTTFGNTGDIFIVQSGHTMTSSNNWSVSGEVQVSGTLNGNNKTLTAGSLVINSGGSYSNTQTTTVSKNFIMNGTATIGGNITVTGTTTIGGSLTLSASGKNMTFKGAVTVNSGGTWNETNASKYYFSGGLSNYGTFTANGSSSSNSLHTFENSNQTINGILTIPYVKINGITLTNNGTLTISGALTEGGTSGLTQGTNAVLNYFGAVLDVDTLTASAIGNTVNYYGAANQTVKPTTYYNLTLSGSGAKTTTSVTVNNILSMEGTATATVAPTYGANATLQYNTTTARTASVEWITPFVAKGGIIIKNTGTITTNGAKVLNCGVPLSIALGSTLTLGTSSPLNVGGNFTNAGTFNSANNALTFGGNVTNTGTMNLGSSTVTIGNCAGVNQSISGFTTTGAVTMTKTSGIATFTGNVSAGALTINGTGGTLNLGAGLTHTFTSVTLTAGTLNGGTSTMKVSGNWTGTGSNFVANQSTVEFNGTGAQAISTVTTFNNLTFSGAGVKTINNNITINSITNITSTSGKITLANGTVSKTYLLYLNNTTPAAKGVWGSTGSAATNKNDTFFTSSTSGTIEATASNRFKITGTSTQTAGSSQNITITALKPDGTTDTAYTGTHTLTFSGANPSPGGNNPTISGTAFGTSTSVTFTNGVATVPMVLYNLENPIISVIDESGYKTALVTEFLNVTVTTTYGLQFITQPNGGMFNDIWSSQPVVKVTDAYGNLDTSAQNITLAIGTNPGSGTLSGTTTIAIDIATSTATFTDLSITNAGLGYTLIATSSKTAINSGTSATFNISNPVPTLLSVSPTSVCSEASPLLFSVTGNNFTSQTKIFINDIETTTTFVSSTSLTAQLSTAQRSAGGTFAIKVISPAPGGGTSTVMNIVVSKIVLTPEVVQPTCFSDGSITLNLSGGIEPYHYSWTDITNSNIIKDRPSLLPGNYQVTVTDAIGCSVTSSVMTLNTPSNCTGITVCNSEAASVFNTTPNPDVITYNWTITPAGATIVSGQNTSSIKVDWQSANPGTYSVCVTETNDCGTTSSVCNDVYVRRLVIKAFADQICSGNTLNLSVEPGENYSWTGPNGFSSNLKNPVIYNASSVNNGTYSVTVIDRFGCSVTTTVDAIIGSAPVIDGSVTNATACGASDGSITLTNVSGGAGFTFLWSNGATTQNISNLSAGVYYVTVTNSLGCSMVRSFSVNTGSGFVTTPTVTNVNCYGGNNGAITLTDPTSGTSPFTYQWDDQNLSTTRDITGLVAGTYNVIITDATGCIGTKTVTVTQPASPIFADGLITNVSCFNGNTGAISQTVTGGTSPYIYSWSKSGGGFTASTKDVSGLTVGTYSVFITDSKSCTATYTYTITQPTSSLSATPTITNLDCNGNNNGQIVLSVSGGTLPYTYSWSKTGGGFSASTKDVSGLGAGNYAVIITDAKGCTLTLNNLIITEPTLLTTSTVVGNVSCKNGNNGSVTLNVGGGTEPYSYLWNNGATTQNLSNLTAGTYSVTVTDAKGCISFISATVSEPELLVATPTINNILCNGTSTGTIALTVIGGTNPYTYLWSNSATTQNISTLTAGFYSVTVTDSKGCTSTTSATITQPSAIQISGNVENIKCNGSATGAIDITTSGGKSPYTYNWGGGITTEDRTNLSAGNYTVTVIDANSCSTTQTFTIAQPTALSLSAIPKNISCSGNNNGNINLIVSGGVLPYTYNWTKDGGGYSATTEDLDGIAAGIYNVTVTDANNCSILTTVSITEPTVLSASITSQTNVTCIDGSNGSATATASGGTAPYSYLWSSGTTTATTSNLAAGTYDVTITDAMGCIATTQAIITEPTTRIELYTITKKTSSCGSNTGAIELIVQNGVSPYSFAWTGPSSYSSTSQNINSLAEGSYNVVVTDAKGCTSTLTNITIEKAATLAITVQGVDKTCKANDGSAYAIVTGGVEPYTYLWSNNATTQFIENLVTNTYNVTVTDANGCLITGAVTLTEPICIGPTASPDYYSTNFNQPLLTRNASINDAITNGPGEFLPMSLPSSNEGTLVWNDSYDGTFSFYPAPGFIGTVRIYYKVEDAIGLSVISFIEITVNPDSCYKPAQTSGTALDTNHGITALGRAGADNSNWPMERKGAWTVLEAKTKGFVVNRLTDTQISAIPAADLKEGMMVYNITQDCLQINVDGTAAGWKCFNTQTCPD